MLLKVSSYRDYLDSVCRVSEKFYDSRKANQFLIKGGITEKASQFCQVFYCPAFTAAIWKFHYSFTLPTRNFVTLHMLFLSSGMLFSWPFHLGTLFYTWWLSSAHYFLQKAFWSPGPPFQGHVTCPNCRRFMRVSLASGCLTEDAFSPRRRGLCICSSFCLLWVWQTVVPWMNVEYSCLDASLSSLKEQKDSPVR